MKTCTILLLVLCVGAIARADDISVWVDPGVSLGSGLYSYTVHLVGSSPDFVAAGWDGSFDGPLNQIKFAGVLDTPSLTIASLLDPADRQRDSHFLLWNADLTTVEAPHESTADLGGVFGIKNEARAQDLAFAQLVIAEGNTVVMSGSTSDPDGTVAIPTNVTIVAGAEGYWYGTSGSDSNGDGTLELQLDQSVEFHGAWGPGEQIWRVYEYSTVEFNGEPVEVVGVILHTTDPDFEFVPDRPGRYEIRPFVFGAPGAAAVVIDVVPEPGALALLAAGAVALLRRKRSQSAPRCPAGFVSLRSRRWAVVSSNRSRRRRCIRGRPPGGGL